MTAADSPAPAADRVELPHLPDLAPLYRKAFARALPRPAGLGRGAPPAAAPHLGRREWHVPEVAVDRRHLAAYSRVCGFPLRDTLPATYPQVLAFPLAMALMTADDFPFPLAGLVHVANRVEVRRPLDAGGRLAVTTRAVRLRPHPRGRQLDVESEVSDAAGVAWRGVATYLRRGPAADAPAAEKRTGDPEPLPAVARWRVGAEVGRAYAAVSGDRNPIHTSRLGARLFGFRRPIAHGMWTKARCLAALDPRLPPRYTATVDFRAPLLLPSSVEFQAAAAGGGWRLAVAGARPHLTGAIAPPTP